MTLEHVRPGDPLSARRWNEMVDRLNNEDLAGADVLTDARITINNPYQYAVKTGDLIPIAGMRPYTSDADACFECFRASGFQLRGTSDSAAFYAVAEEGIPYGGIGRASVPFALCAGFYYEKSGEVNNAAKAVWYSGKRVLESAAAGAFRAVAKSSATTVSEGSYTKRYFAYFTLFGARKNALTGLRKSDANFVTSVSFSGSAPITGIPTINIAHSYTTVQSGDVAVPGGLVTDVSVDANGDLVVTKVALASTASLADTPPTASLSAPTSKALTGLTEVTAAFLSVEE